MHKIKHTESGATEICRMNINVKSQSSGHLSFIIPLKQAWSNAPPLAEYKVLHSPQKLKHQPPVANINPLAHCKRPEINL